MFLGKPLRKLFRAWTKSLDMLAMSAYRLQRQTQRSQYAALRGNFNL